MILNNSKSAKEYISEMYTSEIASIQAKAELFVTPASVIEKEKTENTFRLADAVVERGILAPEVTGEYFEISEKIAEKKKEIEKLYGIIVNNDSLAAIKSAFALLSGTFAQELKDADDAFREKIKQTTADNQTAIDEKKTANSEEVAALKKQADEMLSSYKQESGREKEEYTYNLKRARKQAKEERARVISDREAALQEKENEAKDAKQACLDRLAEIEEMKAKVESIPALIEQAKTESATAKEKELSKDYGYHKMLDEKDNHNKVNELKAELERLEHKYNALCAEKDSLSEKLDQCNAESRQLTSDTVKSIGGINILNSDNHPYNSAGKK